MADAVLNKGTDYIPAYLTFTITEAGKMELGIAPGGSVFPVGLILLTEDETNPADLGLPGTWEEY